jgi:AcrR family transcriptional regulator
VWSILTALLARHLESVNAAVAESLPALGDHRVPLRSAIRLLLERLREAHEAEPRLARAVEQQAGQMPVVPESLAVHRRSYVESVAAILASRPDVRHGNHVLMATLLSEIAEAVSGFLLHGAHGAFRRDEVLEEAVESLCRYVERTTP